MMELVFIDAKKGSHPRRYLRATFIGPEFPGGRVVVAAYGHTDLEMIADAVGRALLCVPRAWRSAYRACRLNSIRAKKAAHAARVRASVEAAKSRRAAA